MAETTIASPDEAALTTQVPHKPDVLPTTPIKDTLLDDINKEIAEAKEEFSELIALVNERYDGPDSILAGKPEQLQTFKAHNEQILSFAVEVGMRKGLKGKELKMAEVAAILHDLAKADKAPEGAADIKNYILAAHGEIAANEAEGILEERPQILEKILGEGYGDEQKKEAIDRIQTAIRSHMGPHPGFMTGILEGVNRELVKKGMPPIEHPYPDKNDNISETVLAADMASLASTEGRKKVVSIIFNDLYFRDLAEKDAKLAQSKGIKLEASDIAVMNGFKSAEEARDMIRDPNDREWMDGLIEKSKGETNMYGDREVKFTEDKWNEYGSFLKLKVQQKSG